MLSGLGASCARKRSNRSKMFKTSVALTSEWRSLNLPVAVNRKTQPHSGQNYRNSAPCLFVFSPFKAQIWRWDFTTALAAAKKQPTFITLQFALFSLPECFQLDSVLGSGRNLAERKRNKQSNRNHAASVVLLGQNSKARKRSSCATSVAITSETTDL